MDEYKYRLEKEYVFKSGIPIKSVHDLFFRDSKKVWLVITTNGDWIISKGYSWNGCDVVPDFNSTKYASLIHDTGYQFRQALNFPYSRKQIDCMFRQKLKQDGFMGYQVYYFGVRWFGNIYTKLKSWF